MQRPNAACKNIIKRFEGIMDGDPKTVNLDPYIDPVGVWTIGWGHALKNGGKLLRGFMQKPQAYAMYPNGITLAEAEVLLDADMLDAAADVERWRTTYGGGVKLTDNQFSALVSWFFNLGWNTETINSTLLNKIKKGDIRGAADEFPRWNHAGGAGILEGLTKRRAAERELFLTA